MLDIEKFKKEKGFSIVDDFNGDIARARKNEKWGYINENGEEVIPCEYESIWSFEKDLCKVKKDDKLFYIDIENNAYYTEKECEIFVQTQQEIAKRREVNSNRIKQCNNEKEIERRINDDMQKFKIFSETEEHENVYNYYDLNFAVKQLMRKITKGD